MNVLTRAARLRIGNPAMLARAAQLGGYAAAAAVLVLGIGKLAAMGATEIELLIGVLAASGLAVGLVVLGTVTVMHEEIRRR